MYCCEIYVLMSFILFKGIFAKHFRLIALSLLVVFLYGSMIWYVFPIKEQMSWEGHLSGLIVGFLFAIIFRKSIAKPKKYEWEREDYNEDDPSIRGGAIYVYEYLGPELPGGELTRAPAAAKRR